MGTYRKPHPHTFLRAPPMSIYTKMSLSSDFFRGFDGSGAVNESCSGDKYRLSCFLDAVELGERDAIAAIRMIGSCLSILGAASIISSAILKKQVWSPKVHPIFVLSIADCMLGFFWILGGILWFRDAPKPVWCYAVSLPTVILECVTINLTLVYALLAYANIKQKDLGNILETLSAGHNPVWPPLKTFVVYCIAWLLPTVVIMLVFGAIAGQTGMVITANKCSCYCFPLLGNVLPYASSRDQPTGVYVYHVRKLLLAYAIILGINYFVVFTALAVIYYKTLKNIRNMRDSYAQTYGTMHSVLSRGHSKAKQRVVMFLTVFTFTGFVNVLLCIFFIQYEIRKLYQKANVDDSLVIHQTPLRRIYMFVHCLQSLIVPLQGFLNAIVYGWTRDDFIQVMAIRVKGNNTELDSSNQFADSVLDDDKKPFVDDDSGIHISGHDMDMGTDVSFINKHAAVDTTDAESD